MTAASARIEMGDNGGALRDLKDIAGELAEKGRASRGDRGRCAKPRS